MVFIEEREGDRTITSEGKVSGAQYLRGKAHPWVQGDTLFPGGHIRGG